MTAHQRPNQPASSVGVGTGEIEDKAAMVTLDRISRWPAGDCGHVLRTPLLPAPPLSALTGAEVFVGCGDLQVTNSFKERGACVKLAALSADERRRGVIAMSAGNHAQAVAYHARRLAIPATIVMPVDDAVRENQGDRDARRHRYSRRRDGGASARRACRKPIAARADPGVRCIRTTHPRSSPGRATVALEMLEDATAARRAGSADRRRRAGRRLRHRGAGRRPSIEVVGVEAALDPSMRQRVSIRTCGRAAARRWRKASPSPMSASRRSRSCANA